MSSRTIPTILQADVAAHNSSKSCYVTLGTKVYDMTDFLESHPGGPELVLEYAGKDVTDILLDESSHKHSESAYEMMEESFIGYVATDEVIDAAVKSAHPDDIVPLPPNEKGLNELNATEVYAATGLASAEDLSKDTDPLTDYKTYKFLDLNKALLPQVWFGGFEKDFYLEQIHRPRHYKGGASAPLFGNFLEPLTKTPWWIIPLVWLPPVAYGTYLASQGLNYIQLGLFWAFGLGTFTLIEYLMHRFLFHLDDHLPNNRVALTTHFLLHGIHHYLPMDKLRLVMPPTLFLALVVPFWKLAHMVFYWNWHIAVATFCGGVFGYICYDVTHYVLHHRKLPSYYQALKKYHLEHHFMDYQHGFGVTSRFWDDVFGTPIVSRPLKVPVSKKM